MVELIVLGLFIIIPIIINENHEPERFGDGKSRYDFKDYANKKIDDYLNK